MNSYGLNDEQYRAITSSGGVGSAPCYVNASAGAGKTRCLISKIQYIIDSTGAPPSSVLCVTFTNKAAKEMKDRLKAKMDVSRMQISTIHSLCVRIIRSFIGHTHLSVPFTIYDDGDQQSIMKTIIKSKELPGNPYEYLAAISKAKGEMAKIEDEPLLTVYNQYQEILRTNNAVDFDDLLILAHQCLTHEDCRKYFSNLWKNVLVDEFQDTSILQYQIIQQLYNPEVTQNLFIVGDINQSIYGWRAAKPENIDHFIKTYKASAHYLTYNYRSCTDVIDHANKFLQFGKPMVAKTPISGSMSVSIFPSQQEEAEQIARALLQMGNYNNTAVLYRMNARSLLFEQTFTRYRIPYKVVNDLGFMNRKVTRDLLAALKASNNVNDRESLARIINTPKRGFGDTKKEQLLLHGRDYAAEVAKDMPLVEKFLNDLDEIKGMPPDMALSEYLNRTGYKSHLEKDSDRMMVDSLQNMVANFKTVEELILACTFIEKDAGEGVNLITAHGSKGLEFDRVFVVGVEHGVWPHANAIDIAEERRLFYVAVTRAKKWLNVSYSCNKMYRGASLSNYPSDIFKETYKHCYNKDLMY